ncbi:FecR family protein, partial [Methyloceanibacter sp.]|uniref:FecR family protein n=1 Tax=Methyloceanibacter sp. TaxID=1965321 RepID=UPI002D6191DF
MNGSPKSQLNIGKSIFFNEHINTTDSGLVQVLLVDGSTFTVGPGSDLTIDKFVYDPNKKSGEMVATFSKGVMRFVGGKLSKNEGGVTVNTPQGALAIRGGMFMGQITGPKSAIYSFLYGVSLTLAGQGTIFQPGNSFYVSGSGTTISPTTQAAINAMMAALTKVGTYNNAGTNPPSGPNQGQLIIQGNNYNEIISTATATQIQDQIQKEIDEFNNALETPSEPGQPQQLTTLFSGYAGGSFTQYSTPDECDECNYENRDPPSGTLSNLNPLQFVPSFDANQNFTGATLSLFVNNGEAGAGGVDIIFVPFFQTNFDVPSGPGAPPTASSLFAGIAVGPNDITAYNGTAGIPPALVDKTTVSDYSVAAIYGFTGAGTVLCTNCDFLKWGGWGADLEFRNTSDTATNHVTALGYWVAGDIIKDTVGALPITGGADYAGTTLASVTTDLFGTQCQPNVQQTYPASGNVAMHWDFGSRSGTFNVSQFDAQHFQNTNGLSFGGNLSAPGVTNAANQFGGPLSGTLPSGSALNGAVTGSFVKGPGQVAGNVPAAAIGNWTISNGARDYNYYNASGIFG